MDSMNNQEEPILDTAEIIYIVIGCLAAVSIILGAALCYIQRKKSRIHKEPKANLITNLHLPPLEAHTSQKPGYIGIDNRGSSTVPRPGPSTTGGVRTVQPSSTHIMFGQKPEPGEEAVKGHNIKLLPSILEQ